MSEANGPDCPRGCPPDRPMPSADKIDAEAVAWFVEQNDPSAETNETSAAAFEQWLAESPKHRMAYWRAEAAWDRAGLLTAVHPSHDLRGGLSHTRRERRDWRLWFAAPAAVAAALVACVIALAQLWGGKSVVYSTPVGGSRTVVLADGSRIELNTDSAVRVSIGGWARDVELVRGEAYFQVKHDPSHPLAVTIGGERVVDLGTEFLLRKDAGRMEVGVVEGSVRLETAGFLFHAPVATLTSGDIAVETADRILITKGAAGLLADDLAWRSGRLVFRRATLAAAAAEFNRYNEEKVVVADSAADLKFSSIFPVHGVDAFARVAKKSFGLQVERQNGEIVITR